MARRRNSERVAVRIARKLVSEIRRRRLRPGTPLPAEHQMVEELGVARATVREALRFLELQGALRIKAGPGGGPVVSAPGADHLASVLSLHLQFADASFRSVLEARCSIYPVLAAEAAANASREDIATLHESIARMHVVVHDPDLFRDEARRFMNLIASASGNRVLSILVEALHRMSGESNTAWDEKQRRSALRSYEKVIRAIEHGEADDARSIMAKSLGAALGHWERTAPEDLKQPVAWIASDRWLGDRRDRTDPRRTDATEDQGASAPLQAGALRKPPLSTGGTA
jgi:DNA-binding FadR family transcriptional regulator